MTFPNNHRNSHTIIKHGWKYSFLLSDLKNCITYRPQKKNTIIRSCVLRAGSGASWCMRWPPWWSRGGTTCRSAAARAAAGTAASPRPRCWGCPCWSARWSPPSPSRPCCCVEAGAGAGGGWDVSGAGVCRWLWPPVSWPPIYTPPRRCFDRAAPPSEGRPTALLSGISLNKYLFFHMVFFCCVH